MDAKRRDEEARRFVSLTLTKFYLYFVLVLDAMYCHLCKKVVQVNMNVLFLCLRKCRIQRCQFELKPGITAEP